MTHEQFISLMAMILMAPRVQPWVGWTVSTLLTAYLVAMKFGGI